MALWTPTSVDETPVIRIANWRIVEVQCAGLPQKTRHICGYNVTEREARVSSPIVAYDPVRRTVTTRSGRLYEMSGQPGFLGSNESYTLGRWCALNEVTAVDDVTDEYDNAK